MNEAYLSRAIGQLEGQLKGIVATLARVDDRSQGQDETIEEIREQLHGMVSAIGTLQKRVDDQVKVTNEFNELQKTIREAGIQAKGISKGFMLGIGFAGAVVGGSAVTFAKDIAALIAKAFTP